MLLAFASNDTTRTILIVIAVGAFLGLIALMTHTVLVSRRNKKSNGEQSVNATSDVAAEEEQSHNPTLSSEMVMSRNVIYSAGLDGQLKPGKYALNSADSSTDKFNVRVNGLVNEYENGDTVALADGDTVSPVSGSVIISIVEG